MKSPEPQSRSQPSSFPARPHLSSNLKATDWDALVADHRRAQLNRRRAHSIGGVIQGQRSHYVDATTQYSPEGYPPTAPSTMAFANAKELAPRSTKKRKERQDRSQGFMSTSDTSSAGPASPTQRAFAPADSKSDPAVSRTLEGPSNPRSHGQLRHEPQERLTTHEHSLAPKRTRPDPRTTKLMPAVYAHCSPKDLGLLISNMLMDLVRINDQIPLRDGRLTRFHSRAPPGISIGEYLQRLIHHATLCPSILLSMVWYIDRLCHFYPTFTINSLTVHRFLITAATVASKGLSDSFWTNPTYARIGGVPVSELASLEMEFLQKVQWRIVPRPEELEEYYRSLVEQTEGYEMEAPSCHETSSSSLEISDEEDREDDQIMEDEVT